MQLIPIQSRLDPPHTHTPPPPQAAQHCFNATLWFRVILSVIRDMDLLLTEWYSTNSPYFCTYKHFMANLALGRNCLWTILNARIGGIVTTFHKLTYFRVFNRNETKDETKQFCTKCLMLCSVEQFLTWSKWHNWGSIGLIGAQLVCHRYLKFLCHSRSNAVLDAVVCQELSDQFAGLGSYR